MSMRWHVLRGVCLLSGLCIATSALAVENHSYCSGYANKAELAAKTIAAQRCGFSGPRWSESPREHQQFCLRPNVSMQTTELEERERNLGVACCSYGVAAAAAVLKASQQNCGFSGPKRSPNLLEHVSWCLAAASGFPEHEAQTRNAALQTCAQRR